MSELDFTQEIGTGADSERCFGPLEARWHEIWHAERSFAVPASPDVHAPAYVFADCAPATGERELDQIRGFIIADVCARFLRAQGRAVLFSLGLDAFGQLAEAESLRSGMPPREWAQRRYRQTLSRLDTLGCSCDWERSFLSSEPELYRWTQWLFLTLLERGQIYRRGTDWLMRIDPHLGEEETLEALTGWDETAIALQREAIGRVDGVELLANTFASGSLIVFSPHAEAIANARFVAISPAHPEIQRWTSDRAVAEQVAALRELESRADDFAESAPMVVTDELATVPGAAGMLPIVISPLVDVRFGATAVLGVPELDPIDRAIAERLPAPAGTAWKVSGSRAAIRPAVRYRAHDVMISRRRAWGPPIPVIDCDGCGMVPVPVGDLPVRLPDDLRVADENTNPLAERRDFNQCTCPSCGGAATRETATIDCRVGRMWMWMTICVPPERRAGALLSDGEYARWLPVHQAVSDVDAARGMFERRMLAGTLQDIGELPALQDHEPFSRVLVHGGVRVEEEASVEDPASTVDLDAMIARSGSDAMRLAMLYAASPARAFTWNDQSARYSRRFLQRLYDYAQPRLQEWSQRPKPLPEPASIDASDRLRRRLAHWCAVACEKLTEQLETLQLQRAVHNAILLLTRIQDFESRALQQRGGTDGLDQEAIVAALLLLAKLLAPLAPHIAEELWSLAGSTVRVSEAGWPACSRPRRAT